jgi:hypothetical protein
MTQQLISYSMMVVGILVVIKVQIFHILSQSCLNRNMFIDKIQVCHKLCLQI